MEQKKSMLWIRIFSIAIPLAVAVLLSLPTKLNLGEWVYNLPHAIGVINTLTAICLIVAFVAIKLKNIKLHQHMNSSAFMLGAISWCFTSCIMPVLNQLLLVVRVQFDRSIISY